MLLQFSGPLDIPNTLESGQAHRWQKNGQWYHSVLFGNLVRLRPTLEGVEFNCVPADESSFAPRLADYLRLQDDLAEIYRSISVDEYLSHSIKRFWGMRILRQEPWECLIAFICSANSNIPRISATMEILADTFGKPLKFKNLTRSTFPTPEALAKAGETRLRELKLGFRAKFVAVAATKVANGELDLMALRKACYQDAKDVLLGLPGVGEKVADCVLLFSLDKLEAFPIDRWVRRVMEESYLDGKKLTYPKLREWALQFFGPYAGYAQQYLFHRRRLESRD